MGRQFRVCGEAGRVLEVTVTGKSNELGEISDGVYSGIPTDLNAVIYATDPVNHEDASILSEEGFSCVIDPHEVTFWAQDNGFSFDDYVDEIWVNGVIELALVSETCTVVDAIVHEIKRVMRREG